MEFKMVRYNRDMLRAAMDEGIVYVEVSSICHALGMFESRIKYEENKLKNNKLYEDAIRYFLVEYKHRKLNVLFIDVEFLTVWLGRMHIAPLVKYNACSYNKFLDYQSNVKNVISAAFNSASEIRSLNERLDKMESLLATYIDESSEHKWERNVYRRLSDIVEDGKVFDTTDSCLEYLFGYLHRNYGFSSKSEKEKFYDIYMRKPYSELELIYQNKTYKKAFEEKLNKMCEGVIAA